jgi:hypothetical protein
MQKTAVNLIRRNKFCASIKNAYICIIDVRGQGYCQNIIVAEGELAFLKPDDENFYR